MSDKYCLECGKEIGKENKFCSQVCSAKFNNRIRKEHNWVSPKRKRRNYCRVCGKYIQNTKTSLCREHWVIECNRNTGELKKKDLVIDRYSSSNKYQKIRDHAQHTLAINKVPKECIKCGYSLHVEVCHIKSIEAFSDETKVSEINSLGNLVYLCRNHHWELDNGILKL